MQLLSKGGAIRSAELHKKKQKEKRLKLAVYIFLILFLIITPIYLSRLERFQISTVEVEGNNVTHQEDINRVATEVMQGKYLFIFPKTNALLYPRKKIVEAIQVSIPRIQNIEVSLRDTNTILVEIVEREPSGLYCVDVSMESSKCYFLDDDGLIFSEAPSFSGDVYFIYSVEPAIESPLGKNYLQREEFQKLPPFISSLKNLNIPIRSLLKTTNEYYLELTGGGKIIVNKDDDLKSVLANLESFLTDQEETRAPDFLERVSYIDLRFGNKVFYKLKGE